jgi:acyl carrier protein
MALFCSSSLNKLLILKRILRRITNMDLEALKEIVAEQLNASLEEITESTNFIEDLGADSLDLFELAMAMEEKFDIEIPSEDLQLIKTVGDAAKYIEGKLA